MTALGLATVGLVPLHLVALGSGLAARAAGRPLPLLGRSGDRWSAWGHPTAFALAFFAPLLQAAIPTLREADPLRGEGGPSGGVPGQLPGLPGPGATLARRRGA